MKVIYDPILGALRSSDSSNTSGMVTGSGTLNFYAKWTPNGTSLGNSLTQDDGTTITVGSGLSFNNSTKLFSLSGSENITGLGTTSATFSLMVHNSTGTSNSLVVRNDGYIGIGTGTPIAKLDIKGSDATASNYALNVSDSTGAFLMKTRNDGITFFNNTNSYWSSGFIQLYGALGSSSPLLSLVNNAANSSIFQFRQMGNAAIQIMNDSANVARIQLYTEGDSYFNGGSLCVGSNSVNASALFEIVSTTKGLLLPRMTTTQKNAISSPTNGLLVYDTILGKMCVYTTAWETVTSI